MVKTDVASFLEYCIEEARRALVSYYERNPDARRVMTRGGGAFLVGEDGISYLIRHSKPFREEEERELSFHLWRLRRQVLRLMMREEYFYRSLETLRKEVLEGKRDVFSVFEWDNFAKSKSFVEEAEVEVREALRKGGIALARAVRRLSLRWSVVKEIAKSRGGGLERRVVETWKEIEDLFVITNVRLVPYSFSFILKGIREDVDKQDLMTEGIFALYRAIDKYDHRKGYRFSTYAMWWIRQHVSKAIWELERKIYLPANVQEKLARLHRVEKEMEMRLERPPTEEELSEEVGIPVQEVGKLRGLLHSTLSLDQSVEHGNGEVDPLAVRIKDENEENDPEKRAVREALREKVMEVLRERLTPIEREVVMARLGFYSGEAEALESIGRRFDRSRSWVKRVEERAIQKLRRGKHASVLLSFLEEL